MKKKILVVDDEPMLVEMISLRLEANGYDVISASDGIEGLEKARRDHPDLIILDLMLPKMDGYKVCRLLKFDAKYKKIPIMLFSSRAQQSDLKLGEEVGADDYLIKPFDANIFLTRIEALLK